MKPRKWMWVTLTVLAATTIQILIFAQEPAPHEKVGLHTQSVVAHPQILAQKVNTFPKTFSQRVVIKSVPHKFRIAEHDEPVLVLPEGTFRPWTGTVQEIKINEQISEKTPVSVHPQGVNYVRVNYVTGNYAPPDPPPSNETDRNINLFSTLGTAWETNVASSGNVVLYTANWNNAFSGDNGKTWTTIDPVAALSDLPANPGLSAFCCDQKVLYIPKIDRFVWIALQSPVASNNENVCRIFYASPAELKSSNGLIWNAYDMHSHFVSAGGNFDQPDIAVGNKFMYLTANVVGGPLGKKAVMARIPLSSFDGGPNRSVEPEYFTSDFWYTRPVQNVGDVGFFAALYSASDLKLFSWGDSSQSQVDLPVATYPREDFASFTPSGVNWLAPSSKYAAEIHGATKAGNEIWVAWGAARSKPPDTQFKQPHIRLAIVDENFGSFVESAISSKDFAYAYPTLATNGDGDVGISYSYGGPTVSPHFGVGFLQLASPGVTFLGASLWRIDPGENLNVGAGGHYQGIRPMSVKGCFVASGNITVSSTRQDAYYVLFGHSGPFGVHCNPLPGRISKPPR